MDSLLMMYEELVECGEVTEDFEGWYSGVCSDAHDACDLER